MNDNMQICDERKALVELDNRIKAIVSDAEAKVDKLLTEYLAREGMLEDGEECGSVNEREILIKDLIVATEDATSKEILRDVLFASGNLWGAKLALDHLRLSEDLNEIIA